MLIAPGDTLVGFGPTWEEGLRSPIDKNGNKIINTKKDYCWRKN
jgi:hypothetical protein